MSKNIHLKLFIYIFVCVFTFSSICIVDISAAAPSEWAKYEVNEAREKGLLISEIDGKFVDNITRKEFCKFIVNMLERTIGEEVKLTKKATPFDDIKDLDVTKAFNLGIVKGVSKPTDSQQLFLPNNLITRQEIAVMMMRTARKLDALNLSDYTERIDVSGQVFNDQKNIAKWAIDDVRQLSKLGIMKGVGNDNIAPLGNTTVEQSILLGLRLYNAYVEYINNPESKKSKRSRVKRGKIPLLRAPIGSGPIANKITEKEDLSIYAEKEFDNRDSVIKKYDFKRE